MNNLFLRIVIPIVAALSANSSAFAAVIASDNFDGAGQNLASFNLTPNNGAPFSTNNNDVFGIVDRNINGRFRDNSATGSDNFGILNSTKTDNVFGVQDLTNGANLGGIGTASWIFDINNAADLSLTIDMAAMGNFEASGNGQDFYSFSASLDGGAITQVITISADESTNQTYLLEGGNSRTINDPLVANGTRLSNQFQTITVDLSSFGTGSQLNLFFFARSNGNEVFAFDNITVSGTPVPLGPSAWLLGSGMLVLAFRPDRAKRRPH